MNTSSVSALPAKLAIYYGDLYVSKDSPMPTGRAENEDQQRTQTHENDPEAVELFRKQVENRFTAPIDNKKFEIVREDPAKILAMRRIVNDNEYQASDQVGITPPRWLPPSDAGWELDNRQQPKRFIHNGKSDELDWLVYSNIIRDANMPELVNDFMGYNSAISSPHMLPKGNWVGDLILDCEVTVGKPQGQLWLDLVKGVDRFQARFDLATGLCKLVRLPSEPGALAPEAEKTLATSPTELQKPGKYRLKFANVDERLIVWVDSSLPFGDGVIYSPPRQRGPTEQDLKPARIGSQGAAVTVGQLKLWRDTYYTVAENQSPSEADASASVPGFQIAVSGTNPTVGCRASRNTLRAAGSFFCLETIARIDGRYWGWCRHLMLGRALMVYYPCAELTQRRWRRAREPLCHLV